jgi:hypothetical protein
MAFDIAKATRIIDRVADGQPLRKASEAEKLSVGWLLKWLAREEGASLRERYARAMQARADAMFEDLADVSEEAVTAETAVQVQGLRLKADNIKWMAAKMAPKKYGDKLELAGDKDNPLVVSWPVAPPKLERP